jgi:hypothetical protein
VDDPEAEWRVVRVAMAEKFGWTFEYIDGMALQDIEDVMAVWSGRGMAEEFGNG